MPCWLQFGDTSYLDHRVDSSLLLSAQNFPFIIWLSIEISPQSEGMWWSSWHKEVALYSNAALGNRIWVRFLALPLTAATCSIHTHAWSRGFTWSFWLWKVKVKMRYKFCPRKSCLSGQLFPLSVFWYRRPFRITTGSQFALRYVTCD